MTTAWRTEVERRLSELEQEIHRLFRELDYLAPPCPTCNGVGTYMKSTCCDYVPENCPNCNPTVEKKVEPEYPPETPRICKVEPEQSVKEIK